MEKQVLGKINGNFTNRECKSHDTQVTFTQLVCMVIEHEGAEFWLVLMLHVTGIMLIARFLLLIAFMEISRF